MGVREAQSPHKVMKQTASTLFLVPVSLLSPWVLCSFMIQFLAGSTPLALALACYSSASALRGHYSFFILTGAQITIPHPPTFPNPLSIYPLPRSLDVNGIITLVVTWVPNKFNYYVLTAFKN